MKILIEDENFIEDFQDLFQQISIQDLNIIE